MKVSVCMITYNHEKFLAQAIESVMMQEALFDYELVIGEDCSTDATRQICMAYQSKYPDKIRLLLPEKNLGMMPNFVQTLNACKGQYIAILDGDDYWTSPYKLQKQVAFLDAHSDYAICFTRAVSFAEDLSREPQHIPSDEYEKHTLTIADLLRYDSIAACSVMFRNGLFGAFPDWFLSLQMGDWPLHIMNAQHGKVGYIPEVMAAYRIHANSCLSRPLVDKLMDCVGFYHAINGYLNFEYDPVVREMLAETYQALSAVHYWRLDLAKGTHFAIESVRSLPRKEYLTHVSRRNLMKAMKRLQGRGRR
jgi:glycosyltransferase involved in cell wall biosynthesis